MTKTQEVKAKRVVKAKKNKKSQPFIASKHRDYLSLLTKSKSPKRRNKLIDLAERAEINAVSECMKNILAGNVPLSKRQLGLLRQHRQSIRELAGRSSTVQKKKRILKQRGGFLLGSIIPLAINALSSIIPGLVSK